MEQKKIELKPGDPNNCIGNGQHPGIECQCDGCDYLFECCRVPGPAPERNAPVERPWWLERKD